MIKVLAIGNSFSQDATHYLQQIAAADKVDMKVANLYIGGCSLERHWDNIQSGAKDYLYEENGWSTDKYVSIQEALSMDKWNYIVTQQASHDSGIPETYHPYIENIIGYLKEKAPEAKLLLHQTWAYEIDSQHPQFIRYHQNQQEMYERLSEAYRSVAAQVGLRMIPSGDVIQALRKRKPFIYEDGGMSLCRDGFHMNILYGRYLLAAVWYKTITGNSIRQNTYIPHTKLAPNVTCNEQILRAVKEIVEEVPKDK